MHAHMGLGSSSARRQHAVLVAVGVQIYMAFAPLAPKPHRKRANPCHFLLHSCSVQNVSSYPGLYLGKKELLRHGDAARTQTKKKTNKVAWQKITGARLVCAFVHGLPDSWEGTECVHLCDNKRCVNPLHLVWACSGVNRSGWTALYREELLGRGGRAYCSRHRVADLLKRWEAALGPPAHDAGRAGAEGGSRQPAASCGEACVAAAVPAGESA